MLKTNTQEIKTHTVGEKIIEIIYVNVNVNVDL